MYPTKAKVPIYKFLLAAFIFLSCLALRAQDDSLVVPGEFGRNILFTDFEKYSNTITFTGKLGYKFKSDLGEFSILQNFQSNMIRFPVTRYIPADTTIRNGDTTYSKPDTIRGTDISALDKESFYFNYKLPLTDFLSFKLAQTWIKSVDSRLPTESRLERINGLGGLEAQFFDNVKTGILFGVENNKQSSLNSTGEILRFYGEMPRREIEDFLLETNFNGEYWELQNELNGGDFNANLAFEKNYSESGFIRLRLNFRQLKRDFISDKVQSDTITNPLESRNEYDLNGELLFGIQLWEKFAFQTTINFESDDIYGYFKHFYQGISITGVERNLQKSTLGTRFELTRVTDVSDLRLGLVVKVWSDQNLLKNTNSVNENDFLQLRNQYNQLDNQKSQNIAYGEFRSNLSTKDTIRIAGNISLYRYDTPSDIVNDDHDEFSSNLKIGYARKLSYMTSFFTTAEIALAHTVYIKAEQSSQNAWNRSIRFSPGINIETNTFLIRPIFEVQANYKVDDFENPAQGIKSFSNRQVSLKDTVFWKFGDNVYLSGNQSFRYYETGVLYWQSFSEAPQTGNMEFFARTLINTVKGDNLTVGIGGRIYILTTRNISQSTTPSDAFSQKSYAPELLCIWKTSDNSELRLNGWYQFQNVNSGNSAEIAYLFLRSTFWF